MDKSVDFYMDLDLSYSSTTSERVVKMISPFSVDNRNDLYVCLSYMNYVHDCDDYNNAKLAIFEFAQPKSTGYEREEVEGESYGPASTAKTKFLRMQIENAEHSGESICHALNQELRAKLCSNFRSKECQFIWNAQINRVEISIDGSSLIEARSRATLIVYYPLCNTLGWTDQHERGRSFQFGAPQGKVRLSQITKENHALASYAPNLPRPEFIVFYLDIINNQVF